MSKAKLKQSSDSVQHLDPIHNDPSIIPIEIFNSRTSCDKSTTKQRSLSTTSSSSHFLPSNLPFHQPSIHINNVPETINNNINNNGNVNNASRYSIGQFFKGQSTDTSPSNPFSPDERDELHNLNRLFMNDEENPAESIQMELLGSIDNNVEEGTKPSNKPKSTSSMPLWLGLALMSHLLWGVYPVLARYLQTECKIPSLSLLFAANIPCSIITLIIILYRARFFEIIKSKMLPMVVLVSAIRASTNLIAPKFTSAIYVQLVTLVTPFIVAGMNASMSIEGLPKGTYIALGCTTIGSILMIIASASPLKFDLNSDDGVGISLALASALFLALYMIMVKKCTTGPNGIPNEELLFFLTFPLVAVGGTFSFILEEKWEPWALLDRKGWMTLIGLAFGSNLCGNFLQVSSIKALGAPMVSSLLGLRLISSLVFSQLIMNEVLKSYFQMVGAFVVLMTITLYLWNQKK